MDYVKSHVIKNFLFCLVWRNINAEKIRTYLDIECFLKETI